MSIMTCPEIPTQTAALELLCEAEANVKSLTDEGSQLHRMAAAGKKFVVFSHARSGGYEKSRYKVSIRLEGQYLDRAHRVFDSKQERDDCVKYALQYLMDDNNRPAIKLREYL